MSIIKVNVYHESNSTDDHTSQESQDDLPVGHMPSFFISTAHDLLLLLLLLLVLLFMSKCQFYWISVCKGSVALHSPQRALQTANPYTHSNDFSYPPQ